MSPGPTDRNVYLHAPSYNPCSWEGLQVRFVFNKEHTRQHLEPLLPPVGLGQSSLNRMNGDIGCCVGSASCTVASHPSTTSSSHCTVTVTAEDYIWGPGQGWQDFSSSGRGCCMASDGALDEALGTAAFGDFSCS